MLLYLSGLAILLCTISQISHCNRVRLNLFLDDDKSIKTEYVDRNNATILAMFNLTEAAINQRFIENNIKNNNLKNDNPDNQQFEQIKEHRIIDIKNRLEALINVNYSRDYQLQEMAAYPICGSDSNDSAWQHDNNVTIRFSESFFEAKSGHVTLDSALLRMYKINPQLTGTTPSVNQTQRCDVPPLDSQIRITVSVVQQFRRNKRERRKRICNTVMLNYSATGWIEIDIKRAIHIWETAEQQQLQHIARAQLPRQQILVGWLLIEVHDEEERPLKPGLFFSPPKCDQADPAIAWSYYRSKSSVSPYKKNHVPRYPRLDISMARLNFLHEPSKSGH